MSEREEARPAEEEVDGGVEGADSGDLTGSFPPLQSADPLHTFDDKELDDDELAMNEKDILKLELSSSLNFTNVDRDLVSVDDTGMYNLISQLSRKVVELDKQVQNPPWFSKVMDNVGRIDGMESTLEKLVEQVASLNTRFEALTNAGLGEGTLNVPSGGGGGGAEEEEADPEE